MVTGDEARDAQRHILLAAIAFGDGVRTHPEMDAVTLIDSFSDDDRHDSDVIKKLKELHLDGTLYGDITIS